MVYNSENSSVTLGMKSSDPIDFKQMNISSVNFENNMQTSTLHQTSGQFPCSLSESSSASSSSSFSPVQSSFTSSSTVFSQPSSSSSLHQSSIWCSNTACPSRSQIDVHRGQMIRLCVKVQVPVQDHPNFNFVGKLLGPKGNSLKWLQEVTQTKMAILGKGSVRDSQKEDEFRKSGDNRYAHLNEPLHVEIMAYATAADAYTRIGHALHQVKRFLVPDYYDDIRKQQLSELGILNTGNNSGSRNHVKSTGSSPRLNIEPAKGQTSPVCQAINDIPTNGYLTMGRHRCIAANVSSGPSFSHHHCFMNTLPVSGADGSSSFSTSTRDPHHDCTANMVCCPHFSGTNDEDKDSWIRSKPGKIVTKIHNQNCVPYTLHRDCVH
ncbi:uncharacterized protein LOC141852112 [Brevipalpus obovatus]|uniref:uncharacterized protein LOC141852112 n=1 Tax=Brevipalpus obovatus TaxID=246614 RepID=UPI003D9EC888